MFSDDSYSLVGNIECIHTDGTTLKGYSLELKIGESIHQSIIEENIIKLLGNDSVIYVKSFENKDTNFYSVEHIMGKKILNVLQIDVEKYDSLTTSSKFKYQFPKENNIQ